MYNLKRNYSSRNFKTLENGNNFKPDYETSTYNTFNLNDSYEEDFYDNNLDDKMGCFFNTMDSFYNQKKEIEDFNNFTDDRICQIHNWYDNKRQNFINKYKEKKSIIMENYKKSLRFDIFPCNIRSHHL